MDNVYKSILQSYALKHSKKLPVYSTEREGPDHAPKFQCQVTVCGETFKSPGSCPRKKAAEHAAAKVALTSLNPEEVVNDFYKNMLQDIAMKEHFCLPVYVTYTSGPPHAPTFTSSVEFVGRIYKGKEGSTKKEAEMSAAAVAFISIMDLRNQEMSLPENAEMLLGNGSS